MSKLMEDVAFLDKRAIYPNPVGGTVARNHHGIKEEECEETW